MTNILAAFPELPLIVALASAAVFLRVVRSLVVGALLLLVAAVVGAVVIGLLGFTLAALLLQ